MTFAAKFRGICEACEDDIEVGEDVQYTLLSDLVHAECYVSARKETLHEEVCLSCWMVKPCECDD